MKSVTRAIPYAFVYPILTELAREKGYALALHGSMQSDLDVAAIPWTEDACSAHELMEHLSRQIWVFHYCDSEVMEFSREAKWQITEPTQKPHGRLAWTIPLKNGLVIDLSVMPRTQDRGD